MFQTNKQLTVGCMMLCHSSSFRVWVSENMVLSRFFHFPIEPRGYPPLQDKCEDHNGWVKHPSSFLIIFLTYTIYSEISLSPLPHGYGEFHWWEISTWVGELHIKGCISPWLTTNPCNTIKNHATPRRYIHYVQHTFYILKRWKNILTV